MKMKFYLPIIFLAASQIGCQPPQKEDDVLSKLKPEDLVRGETPESAPAAPSQPLSLAELQSRAAQLAANNAAVFEENKGQFGPGAESILYRAQGRDQQFYIRVNGWSNVRSSFTPDPNQPEVKAEPGKPAPPPRGKISTHRVDVSWLNFNSNATLEAKNPAQETRNFLGTQAGDIMGVRLFGNVIFNNLYNQIDVEFSLVNNIRQQLYTVKPGANLDDLRFLIEYADEVKIDDKGRLIIVTKEGDVPFTLSAEQNGQEIPAQFVLVKTQSPQSGSTPKPKGSQKSDVGGNYEFSIQLKGSVDKNAPYTITLLEK
jgi:hypothetical protein